MKSIDSYREEISVKYPELAIQFGEEAGSKTLVTLTCEKHGDTVREARLVVGKYGRGCKGCISDAVVKQPSKKLTTVEGFKVKVARLEIKEDVLFETFTGLTAQVKLQCIKHGIVSVRADSLLRKKAGCPECAKESARLKLRIPVAEAIERARAVHGDTYTYVEKSYSGIDSKMQIVCKEHGEFSQYLSSHIKQKAGCPECAVGRARWGLRVSFTEFVHRARAVHGDRYGYSEDGYRGNISDATIMCKDHGEFKQSVSNHLAGKGCKACGVRQRSSTQTLPYKEFVARASEAHSDRYSYIESSYTNVASKVSVVCSEHGTFSVIASNHLKARVGCPKCVGRVSTGEKELAEFVTSLLHAEKSVKYQGAKEFDIYIPSKKLAIEYDGLPWHSTKYKTPTEQVRKAKDADELGVELIRVFEHEWLLRRKQVESLILARLGASKERLYARKCNIVKVTNSEARVFHNENHIQGWSRNSGEHIGLEFEGKLAALMTFTKNLSSRKAEEGVHELVRFSSSVQVVGGASKLLKSYIEEFSPLKVLSYSDKRLFSGRLYERLGFEKVHDVAPSYSYWKDGTLELKHKALFKRENLEKLFGDKFAPEKTEKENCEANGYFQVYDDGKVRWELTP